MDDNIYKLKYIFDIPNGVKVNLRIDAGGSLAITFGNEANSETLCNVFLGSPHNAKESQCGVYELVGI